MQRLGLFFFFSALFLAVFIQAAPLDGESDATLVRRKGLRLGGGGRPAPRPPSRPPIVTRPKPTIIKKPHPTIIKKPHSETTIKKSTSHTESHSSTTPPSSQSATTPPSSHSATTPPSSSQSHSTTSAPAASHTTTPPGGTLTGTGSASHSATRTSDPEATDTDLPNLPSVPTKTKKGLHWPTGASGEPLGGGLWRNLPGVSLSFDPSGAGWCRKIKVNIGAPGTGGIYGGGYGGGYGDTSGYPADGSVGYKARAKRSKTGKKVRKGKGKGKGKKSKKTPKADRAAL